MNEAARQVHALKCYTAALAYFKKGQFAKAHRFIREYRHSVDYHSFSTVDARTVPAPHATVIIITRDRGEALLVCLKALENQEASPAFEIIVVNNGGNLSLKEVLEDENVLLVECPIPFTPSEGRNIGAFHARSKLLIFLDDDAIADTGFVRKALQAFDEHPFLGIRGRILPTSSDADNSLAGLYDLGDYPLPAILDVEGNIAIPSDLYKAVEGMNPLLFGAEGLDLTARLLNARPAGEVFYWPGMVIRHDYASGDQLLAKRQRQALANEYFRVMNPSVLKVKERYAALYRTCRKPDRNPSLKTLPARLRNVGRDMCLSVQSEKALSKQMMHPGMTEAFSQTMVHLESSAVTPTEAKTLLQRIHVLESEVETTRRSVTFRIGHLIKDAWQSTFRQKILLPLQMLHLINEYRTRSKGNRIASEQAVWRNGIAGIFNQSVYTQPGRQEHVFDLFDGFTPYRKTRNSDLRIACILSPWLQACLDLEAELIPLRVKDWQIVLERKQPDFLLVQSLIEKSGTWQECSAAPVEIPAELTKLVSFCNRKKIPTVFWDTEDHIHFPLFSKTACSFDRVFAADPVSASGYSALLNQETPHLGPAIQPALHNPLKPVETRASGLTLLMDGWADILEFPEAYQFLKPLIRRGLHIIESRYRLMANKLDDLPEFKKSIMGCVSFDHRLSALRHYPVIIMPDQSLSSPMTRSWQAIEAIACGCSVVMSGHRNLTMPDGLIIRTEDNVSMGEKALELLKDDTSRMRSAHLARRTLYATHTYAHRLRSICKSLGLHHDWEEFPLVSVILPTKRPELIRACLEKFTHQEYPNKELIVVINSDANVTSDLQRLIPQSPTIRVFQLHAEKNIGICLNFGVAQSKGTYWFKMDDDDYYGPNYLSDMMHLARMADFHILGKPPAFIYLEGRDKTYLRDKALQTQHTIGSILINPLCGATLGGRKDQFPEFSENHRACVDSAFVEGSKTKDYTLITGDIWNFIAYRSGDKGKHTWRHADEEIIESADPVCSGLNFNQVMI